MFLDNSLANDKSVLYHRKNQLVPALYEYTHETTTKSYLFIVRVYNKI